MAGNGAVAEFLQRDSATAVRSDIPLLTDIQVRLAPWVLESLKTDDAGRQYLLDLYAKLGPFWKHIPDKGIIWVGRASMLFVPDDEAPLRADLVKAGFRDRLWATRGDDTWGLREPDVESAALHWRGKPGGKVEVHIDLHPPSGTGLWHWWEDSYRRESTHTPETLRAGLEAAKVEVPILSQREAHGRLTVRLNNLRQKFGADPDVTAEFDKAAAHLAQAGAILWNQDVISHDQLNQAAVLLAQADLEMAITPRAGLVQPR